MIMVLLWEGELLTVHQGQRMYDERVVGNQGKTYGSSVGRIWKSR